MEKLNTKDILELIKSKIYCLEVGKEYAECKECVQHEIDLLELCKKKLILLNYMQINIIDCLDNPLEIGFKQVIINMQDMMYEEFMDL